MFRLRNYLWAFICLVNVFGCKARTSSLKENRDLDFNRIPTLEEVKAVCGSGNQEAVKTLQELGFSSGEIANRISETSYYTALFRGFAARPIPLTSRKEKAWQQLIGQLAAVQSDFYRAGGVEGYDIAIPNSLKNLLRVYIAIGDEKSVWIPQEGVFGARRTLPFAFNSSQRLSNWLRYLGTKSPGSGTDPERYGVDVANDLNKWHSTRGGMTIEDLLLVYLIKEHPRILRYGLIQPNIPGNSANIAVEIFQNKTTPNLACNNLIGELLTQPIEWETLGMDLYRGHGYLAWFHGWPAYWRYKYPKTSSAVPLLGSLYQLADNYLTIREGRDAQGNAIQDGLVAESFFAFAMAVNDLFLVRDISIGLYSAAKELSPLTDIIRNSPRTRDGVTAVRDALVRQSAKLETVLASSSSKGAAESRLSLSRMIRKASEATDMTLRDFHGKYLEAKLRALIMKNHQSVETVVVNVQDTLMLHPLTFGPALDKSLQRATSLREYFSTHSATKVISLELQQKLMTSVEPMRAIRLSSGKVVIFDGNGRHFAVLKALGDNSVNYKLELSMYQLSGADDALLTQVVERIRMTNGANVFNPNTGKFLEGSEYSRRLIDGGVLDTPLKNIIPIQPTDAAPIHINVAAAKALTFEDDKIRHLLTDADSSSFLDRVARGIETIDDGALFVDYDAGF